jgi:hypothetical protein
MVDINKYSFSDPFNRGIDFYTIDGADVSVDISGSGNLVVDSIAIRLSDVSLSSLSNVSINFTKISYAIIDISGIAVTATVATERQDVAISVSANTTLTVSSIKISNSVASLSSSANLVVNSIRVAISSSTLSSNSTLTTSAYKFASAISAPSGSASLSVGATIIRYAAALLSGSVSVSTAGRIVLATIRIQLFENATVSAEIIKFSAVTGVDTSSIRTLLLLDGKPLTNQNRTLDVTSTPVFIENRNWNASSSRYYKNQTTADKKSFSLNWSFIPNFMEKTVDNKYSRDYIRQISKDPDAHTLTIINSDANGLTPYTETVYNVLVKDFNESLIRRDIPDNTYYFNCSMTLEEV